MSKHIALALFIATIGIVSALWLLNAQNQPIEICADDIYGLNDYRRNHGLHCLTEDPYLVAAARQRAEAIEAFRSPWSHDGYEEVILYTLGYVPKGIGENLTANIPVDKVIDRWDKSPAHQANLQRDFTHYGMYCTQRICAMEFKKD